MKRLVISALLACTLLPACSAFSKVDEDNFGKQYAKAMCSYWKRCSAFYFYYDYSDEDDCRDEIEDWWDDDGEENCDFDDDKAQECIDGLNGTCKAIGDDDWDDLESCSEICDD